MSCRLCTRRRPVIDCGCVVLVCPGRIFVIGAPHCKGNLHVIAFVIKTGLILHKRID